MTVTQLVLEYKGTGDEDCIKEIIDRLKHKVETTVNRSGLREEDKDDVVQEILSIHLMRCIKHFLKSTKKNITNHFETLFYTDVLNTIKTKIIGYYRYKHGCRMVDGKKVPLQRLSLETIMSDTDIPISDTLCARETVFEEIKNRDLIHEAMNCLARHSEKMFVENILEGYSILESCERAGIPRTSITSFRKRLQQNRKLEVVLRE